MRGRRRGDEARVLAKARFRKVIRVLVVAVVLSAAAASIRSNPEPLVSVLSILLRTLGYL